MVKFNGRKGFIKDKMRNYEVVVWCYKEDNFFSIWWFEVGLKTLNLYAKW